MKRPFREGPTIVAHNASGVAGLPELEIAAIRLRTTDPWTKARLAQERLTDHSAERAGIVGIIQEGDIREGEPHSGCVRRVRQRQLPDRHRAFRRRGCVADLILDARLSHPETIGVLQGRRQQAGTCRQRQE